MLTSPECLPYVILPLSLCLIQQQIPVLRKAVRVVIDQASRWQRDFRVWQPVFLKLEPPTVCH